MVPRNWGDTLETIHAGTHPQDESSIAIQTFPDVPIQYLTYHLGNEAHRRATFLGVDFDPSEWPLPLAEFDQHTGILKTFPTFLNSGQRVFTRPKYRYVKWISFEDQPPMSAGDGFDLVFELPYGFYGKPFSGFGLDPQLKHIIKAFEALPEIDSIAMCDDTEMSIEGSTIRFPLGLYHEVRMSVNRAHEAAINFANNEKLAYLKSRLLPSIVPGFVPEAFERSVGDLQETVRTALLKKGVPKSRNTNTAAALRTVSETARELAERAPVQVFELSEKLELISLEKLIDDMALALSERHLEEWWQTFFKSNPFIFKILFGLPVVMYVDKASVGGMGHHRAGEKYADFLLEAGSSGNLAIVEIKTPQTDLVTPQPYRDPTLYGPNKDLGGGVAQILEQRYNLVASIKSKQSDERNLHIQAWSVQCFLIIGSDPTDDFIKRSFELYRHSQRDVLIITFDELLAKLRSLHEFLSTKPQKYDPHGGLI